MVIGPGLLNVVVIIALFTWYYPARIVRGATLSSKRMTFVAAARTVGARPRRILFVHLLPQVWGPLLVYGTSIIANNIIFEAGLSYLGRRRPAADRQLGPDAVGRRDLRHVPERHRRWRWRPGWRSS